MYQHLKFRDFFIEIIYKSELFEKNKDTLAFVTIYETKYSRMDQVKWLSLTNFPWSILEHFVPYIDLAQNRYYLRS